MSIETMAFLIVVLIAFAARIAQLSRRDSDDYAQDSRISELERKADVLAERIQTLFGE